MKMVNAQRTTGRQLCLSAQPLTAAQLIETRPVSTPVNRKNLKIAL